MKFSRLPLLLLIAGIVLVRAEFYNDFEDEPHNYAAVEVENELRAKTTANLKAGNRELAGQYAYQLKGVRANLEESRGQLEAAEKTYQELIRSRDVAVKAAREKISSLQRDITDMKMHAKSHGRAERNGHGDDFRNRWLRRHAGSPARDGEG